MSFLLEKWPSSPTDAESRGSDYPQTLTSLLSLFSLSRRDLHPRPACLGLLLSWALQLCSGFNQIQHRKQMKTFRFDANQLLPPDWLTPKHSEATHLCVVCLSLNLCL